ncbi:MAG: cytochrome oxidase Cu insertion factor (SCO1/SenC/PrrC family) [Cellvibrionaceae bacterium]|jgi:cytochrome oxidase Cu insertion factor (SCO1/SenC/PrrC family)
MNSEKNQSTNNQSIKKRNKFYGLLIVAVIVLPMIIAYTVFKTGFAYPTGTTNKGELLLPPQPIQGLVLQERDGLLTTLYSTEKKRWRILVPVSQDCDEKCKAYLYLTRQVHIRLAEKAYRVERILLLLDSLPEAQTELLMQEHRTTRLVKSSPENLQAWLAEVKLPLTPENYFYLVDQEGFVMMRYDSGHTGQDLLDDIKKLLKFTYDK